MLKKLAPTLAPALLTVLAMFDPQIQHWISAAVGPILAAHPAMAAGVATLVVAVYHALPSPLQK